MSAVLIVDDSPAEETRFRSLLNRAGYQVDEVATGAEALAQAAEVRPHMVVLAVNLPDSDGHAVCRALRADPRCAGIPILMLTARDDEADALAGLEAGADDYVARDAAAEIILARVHRLVRYRQMAHSSVLNEQLAQVGRLLAGIIHEIRGPLSVIRGNAELMRLSLGEEDVSKQWIGPIIRACQLLQARLEHLMAAVRGGPAVLQDLEVVPLAREAAGLFQKGIDPRRGQVTIVTDFAETLPLVRADAGRLLQVLLNLLSNAHEAIVASQGQGRITVRATQVHERERDWVQLTVADDGPGIPEALMGRIFEPFFTTKDAGSGYGLYLASEILREHGGHLTVCNNADGGACFTLWLPLATSSPGA